MAAPAAAWIKSERMEYASASTTTINMGKKPTMTVAPEANAAVPKKNACSIGPLPITCNSAPSSASARRAHRRGIAGVEHDLRELFDLLPVRAFVFRARPGIERNEIDLGRNAL